MRLITVMASVVYDAFKRRKNRIYFWSVIICSLLCVFFSITTGGRTTLLLFVVNIIMSAIIDFSINFNNKSKASKYFFVCLLVLVIVLTSMATLAYVIDVFGFRDLYENSFLGRDGGVLHNVRLQAAKDGVKQMIQYPEGGWYGTEALPRGGTHNTWLEFARYYNTVIFVILLLYVLIVMKNFFWILLNKKYSETSRFFLCNITFSMFCYMCLEPVGAVPGYYYVIFFIFVSGILNKCANLSLTRQV